MREMSETGWSNRAHGRKNESSEWYTPPHIFEALGLTFDLDPCAPPEGYTWTVPARSKFTEQDDGLLSVWPVDANVFMNPPYGYAIPAWMNKMSLHGKGIALVFARLDTEWFHRFCTNADAICFVKGRLNFIHPEGEPSVYNAGAPSMLVAWGADNVAALERSQLGAMMRF